MDYWGIEGNESTGYTVYHGNYKGLFSYPDNSEGEKQARAQCKALNAPLEAAKAAKKQEKQLKKQKKEENRQSGKGKFHGIYCLLVGWWLAMVLICCIVPLFFKGGRSLIKKAFGIW